MSKKQPIEAKPTTYANILFRSRLEARWAVFLDFTPNILNWTYEPQTFKLPNGWEYTPDFLVEAFRDDGGQHSFYMEVKPTKITLAYQEVLGKFSKHCEQTLLIICGDFYKQRFLGGYFPNTDKIRHIGINEIFTSIDDTIRIASQFRFDLEV